MNSWFGFCYSEMCAGWSQMLWCLWPWVKKSLLSNPPQTLVCIHSKESPARPRALDLAVEPPVNIQSESGEEVGLEMYLLCLFSLSQVPQLLMLVPRSVTLGNPLRSTMVWTILEAHQIDHYSEFFKSHLLVSELLCIFKVLAYSVY